MAFQFFLSYAADFISVVPRKFGACTNLRTSEDCNPRKTQILGIDEYVLNESVWLARMLNVERKLLKLTCLPIKIYGIVNIIKFLH